MVDASGRHRVVSSGPLPEAVAASAAIPCIFRPVAIPGAATHPFEEHDMYSRGLGEVVLDAAGNVLAGAVL